MSTLTGGKTIDEVIEDLEREFGVVLVQPEENICQEYTQ